MEAEELDTLVTHTRINVGTTVTLHIGNGLQMIGVITKLVRSYGKVAALELAQAEPNASASRAYATASSIIAVEWTPSE